MHSDVVIAAKNLVKTYRVFAHPGDRIREAFTLGRLKFHREFTAIRDVSFEIRRGEMVGIIGRNGSGKSTLLQLVCGILKPTAGEIQVNGRISALLELGAGFNPEFTGRENVYFQGAVMGFTRAEVDRRFDDIAAFADIGEFIDQPVRVYSSGMFVRLAFAVSVSVNPEILVVDEALAVGDAGFRSRCFRRIGELRHGGCTILFVSHEMGQIVDLCSQAMLVDEGQLLLFGQPKFIVGQFNRLLSAGPDARRTICEQLRELHAVGKEAGGGQTVDTGEADDSCSVEGFYPHICADHSLAYEPNGALIDSVQILSTSGQRVNQLYSGRIYRCVYRVHFTRNAANVRFAMLIKTPEGVDLGGAMSVPAAEGIPGISQGSTTDVEFEFNCMLNSGTYHLNVAAFGSVASVEYALHGIVAAEVFRVVVAPGHLAIAKVDFGCRATIRMSEAGVQ